jgi:hypothetical protein
MSIRHALALVLLPLVAACGALPTAAADPAAGASFDGGTLGSGSRGSGDDVGQAEETDGAEPMTADGEGSVPDVTGRGGYQIGSGS